MERVEQSRPDLDAGCAGGGGPEAAPAPVGPSRTGRWQLPPWAESPWTPVLLKGLGALLLMLALAAVGYVSSVRGSTSALDRHIGPSHALVGEALAAGRGDDARAPRDRGDAGASATDAITADGKVVLNLAGPAELTRLPGIGKRRAEAIVALRARLKRFRRVSQLLGVRGIGRRRLEKIAPLVVLDPPDARTPTDGGGAG